MLTLKPLLQIPGIRKLAGNRQVDPQGSISIRPTSLLLPQTTLAYLSLILW